MSIRCAAGHEHAHILSKHAKFLVDEHPCVVDSSIGPEVTFTFVDIVPGLTAPNKYHKMSELMAEANLWLARYQDWTVINCETVQTFLDIHEKTIYDDFTMEPDKACFPLEGRLRCCYVMTLRLWIRRERGLRGEEKVRSLKYVQFSPNHSPSKDGPVFEGLLEVLERMNEHLKSGKVDETLAELITAETLNFPVEDDDWLSPNGSHLIEDIAHRFPPRRSISVIRLFYYSSPEVKCSTTLNLVIGFKDFVPEHISGGSFFSRPHFEPLSEVIVRASNWLSEHCEADFLNAQCLEVKMKTIGRVDTNLMSCSADRGNYIRMFRVAYVNQEQFVERLVADGLNGGDRGVNINMDTVQRASGSNDYEDGSSSTGAFNLSSIIFTPSGSDATVQEIRRKLNQWVERTESAEWPSVQILSAETVEIFTKNYTGDEIRMETENTFKCNRMEARNAYLFFALRLYLLDRSEDGSRARGPTIIASQRPPRNHCVIS